MHCVAHRLALATAQAGNQTPYLKKVKDWLAALWKHFHYSSVRTASLVEVQRLMQLDELKVVKAADTRWLSHHASVTSLLRILPAVLRVLHDEGAKDPTAYGLHKQMATHSFIAALYLLDDCLSAVSRLSRAFQSSTVDLSIIQPLVLSTQSRVKCLKDKSALVFQSEVNDIIEKVESRLPDSELSPGLVSDEEEHVEQPYQPEICIATGEKERFEPIRLQFLQGVLDNIAQRFPSIDVVDSFCVLQPENLSDNHSSTEKLEMICGHYLNSPLEIGVNSLKEEWGEFVEFSRNHSALKEAKSLQDMARELLHRDSLRELFSLVVKLYSRAVAFPVSTADCEQAFSAMNRIKTDLRRAQAGVTLILLLPASSGQS